jgi:hypothetical protein
LIFILIDNNTNLIGIAGTFNPLTLVKKIYFAGGAMNISGDPEICGIKCVTDIVDIFEYDTMTW